LLSDLLWQAHTLLHWPVLLHADLDLTDHLEPDLPAAAELDHLALVPEEEGTDTEVKSNSEETDEESVTEIVNKTATKP